MLLAASLLATAGQPSGGMAATDSVRCDPKSDSIAAVHSRIVRLGRMSSCPEVRFGPPVTGGANDPLLPWPSPPVTAWRKSDPHPLLDSVLPGVSFILAQFGHGEARGDWRVAVIDNRRALGLEYNFSLASVLRSQGFRLDSTETYCMAKVATLLAYFARRPDTSGPNRLYALTGGPDPAAGPAFPRVDFLSARQLKNVRPDGRPELDMQLECRIDGIRRIVSVAFARDSARRYMPGRISTPDMVFHYLER
jgi:hypothetical protein